MKLKNKLCRDQGSNQGPSNLQSYALPTELSRHSTVDLSSKTAFLNIVQTF